MKRNEKQIHRMMILMISQGELSFEVTPCYHGICKLKTLLSKEIKKKFNRFFARLGHMVLKIGRAVTSKTKNVKIASLRIAGLNERWLYSQATK